MLLYNSYTAYIQRFKLFVQLFELLVFVLVHLKSFFRVIVGATYHTASVERSAQAVEHNNLYSGHYILFFHHFSCLPLFFNLLTIHDIDATGQPLERRA